MTSEPISGCRSQIVCSTDLRDWASSVSSNRGRESGRPVTSLPLGFFVARAMGRDDIRGLLDGEVISSSSFFRFRLAIFGGVETAGVRSKAW